MRQSLLIALVALAACSPGGDRETQKTAEPPAPRLAETNAQPVVAPTGDAQLTPLTASAAETLGAKGAGCKFAYQGRTLLVATGGPDATAVAVIDGADVELGQVEGATADEPMLAGGGYTASVLPTGGGAADLAIAGPGGRKTVFTAGTWSCGQ